MGTPAIGAPFVVMFSGHSCNWSVSGFGSSQQSVSLFGTQMAGIFIKIDWISSDQSRFISIIIGIVAGIGSCDRNVVNLLSTIAIHVALREVLPESFKRLVLRFGLLRGQNVSSDFIGSKPIHSLSPSAVSRRLLVDSNLCRSVSS